jgi:hypothetical protein
LVPDTDWPAEPPPAGVVEPLAVDPLPDDDLELLEQATPTRVSKAIRISRSDRLLLLR